MKVKVTVQLKSGVLDPQGKAIENAIASLGFKGAEDVRAGKVIEFTAPDNTSDDDIKMICDKLLANPVMENYIIDIDRENAA